jgi:hypothetical protein
MNRKSIKTKNCRISSTIIRHTKQTKKSVKNIKSRLIRARVDLVNKYFDFMSSTPKNICFIYFYNFYNWLKRFKLSLGKKYYMFKSPSQRHTFQLQWKPLNVITLGQRENDNNNRMIRKSKWTYIKEWFETRHTA